MFCRNRRTLCQNGLKRANVLLKELDYNDGFLPLNDKSDPEIIKQKLEMSKAAFKRACGHLLKANKIDITDDGIRRR